MKYSLKDSQQKKLLTMYDFINLLEIKGKCWPRRPCACYVIMPHKPNVEKIQGVYIYISSA